MAAHDELYFVARAELARKKLRRSWPIWLGMTAISGYNVTRMPVLSASGRIGALAGLTVGTMMTFRSLTI